MSVQDPIAEPGTQSGQISGGPLVIADSVDGATTGTLTCRIQVNQPTAGGSGPSISRSGTGVFVVDPEVVDYHADDDDNVYLCSSFADASEGVTYYWNDVLGEWSPDINTPCSLAFGSDEPTPEEVLIDSILCPILAIVFPPEGDIPFIWDCPPYGNMGDGSLPEGAGAIVAVKTGSGPATLVTPPGWDCTFTSNTATDVSVSCVPPGVAVNAPCPLVTASADATAAPGETASATSSCVGGTAAATATAIGHDEAYSVALTLPWTCSFAFSPNLTTGWASCGVTYV